MNSKTMLLTLLMMFTILNLNAQRKYRSLEDLVAEAVRVNPKIKALNAKLKIAANEIEINTNLPDPVLTIGAVNLPTNSFSFTQEPMTGKIIGLSQKVPFPGALSAAADVKSVDTLIVWQEIADLKNKIKNEVSELYFKLQLKREELSLAKSSLSLLEQISKVVKRKYEVGTAGLQNIISVEVQITRVKDKIEILKGNEKSIIAQLNAYLLRTDNSAISTSPIEKISKLNVNTEGLLLTAEQNRPALKSIELLKSKAGLMEKHAEYSFYPNFKFGVQYTQRDYSGVTGKNYHDLVSFVVGITLPINYGGNKTAKIEKAKYLQQLYGEQFNSSLQILQQSFGKINAKLSELAAREKLIVSSLLPQAEEAYKSSIADYQVGKIDFANVIKAENDIIKINTELAKVRTDYRVLIVKLEFLSGTDFNNFSK